MPALSNSQIGPLSRAANARFSSFSRKFQKAILGRYEAIRDNISTPFSRKVAEGTSERTKNRCPSGIHPMI